VRLDGKLFTKTEDILRAKHLEEGHWKAGQKARASLASP